MNHTHSHAAAGGFTDITAFGSFHGSSSHTAGHDLQGGRTPITTEAHLVYNGFRAFFGQNAVAIETIGQWAFANDMTNNDVPYGDDLSGVGLYYAMQGVKVGWIRDDAFSPQILADIQRTARLGDSDDVMTMVQQYGHAGLYEYLNQTGLADHFVSTMKMEPHYGGWMHGRVHGDLVFRDGSGSALATAHDVNHLTVLSHDQSQPFMNDTFDWPQWPALNVMHPDVIDYFQSMVMLGDPLGDELPSGTTGGSVFTAQGDTWQGSFFADAFNGLGGDDVIQGLGGNDLIFGGGGSDMLWGGWGNDAISGDAGDDKINGQKGADWLYGKAGDDRIFGAQGNDALFGGFGDDLLSGGQANDSLTGGNGADRFRFVDQGGRDQVTDFEDNIDTLLLDASLWSGTLTVAQAVNRFAQEVNGHVVFTFDDGEELTVHGVATASQLLDDIVLV